MRADLAAGAASLGALGVFRARLRAAFFLTGRLAEARERLEDARARRAIGLFRPFVFFFARRLTFGRARFAMIKIPFKFLTGLR
jgi:hypothetical protein